MIQAVADEPPMISALLRQVYIGDVKKCKSLRGADTEICAFGDAAALPVAPKYSIMLDTLTEDESARVSDFCAYLRTFRSASIVCVTTVGAIKKDAECVAWHAKHGSTFAGIELPLDERLVQCASRATDLDSRPSLEWYTHTLNHALGKRQPTLCLVLHGPSGIGKTLAASRIEAILARRRDAALPSEKKTPDFLSISAALVDPSNANNVMRDMRAHSARSRDNILVLDDIEAATTDSVLKLMEKLTCRRIVICNDFFALANRALRNEEVFYDISVNRAHKQSLATYIGQCFASLTPVEAQHVAETANGDVRAALIYAKWFSLRRESSPLLSKKRVDYKDASRLGEAPHYAILRCSRARDVLAECERTFGEGDADTPAQILYENHPRYNGDDLEVAATICDLQSLADVYDNSRQRQNYDGSDASATDKKMHFALAYALPCCALSQSTKKTHDFSNSTPPHLVFPFANLHIKTNAAARSVHRAEAHRLAVGKLSDRETLNCAVGVGLSNTAVTENTLDWIDVLFGALRGQRLVRAFEAARVPQSKQDQQQSDDYDALVAVVDRAATLGLDGADFAFACERYSAFYDSRAPLELPTPLAIQKIFAKIGAVVEGADAHLLDDTVQDGDGIRMPKPRAARKRKSEIDNGAVKQAKTAAKKGNSLLDRFANTNKQHFVASKE